MSAYILVQEIMQFHLILVKYVVFNVNIINTLMLNIVQSNAQKINLIL